VRASLRRTAEPGASPLRLRSQVIGSLNLFHAGAGGLANEELRIAQALTDAATIGILQQRTIRRGEVVAGQLQSAFGMLRATARSRNRLLSDLAREVASGPPTPCSYCGRLP
jgi:hypothetical protein